MGEVDLLDILHLLHFTIDHTDTYLMYTSQFIHCLQVFVGVNVEANNHAAAEAVAAGSSGNVVCRMDVPNSCMVLEDAPARRLAEVTAPQSGWRRARAYDVRRLDEGRRLAERAGGHTRDREYWRDMQVAALVHDVGKLLSVFGEADHNVDCMNRVVGFKGRGLDNLDFQW